jgi:hypothetical protein
MAEETCGPLKPESPAHLHPVTGSYDNRTGAITTYPFSSHQFKQLAQETGPCHPPDHILDLAQDWPDQARNPYLR